MFMIEWLFDKMGYTKKIDWTSLSLTWEDVEPPKKRKPVKKVATKRTTALKKSPRKKA